MIAITTITTNEIPNAPARPHDAQSALSALAAIVEAQQGGDIGYFRGQSQRFERTAKRLLESFPPPCRVLDIGSHYLHQTSLMKLMGYDVHGLDIPLFAEAPFVAERARLLGISNHSTTALERGTFLVGHDDSFDLIVFTEILEHITFNPVAFWRRVYELLEVGGCVYLTTPNAMRPSRVWRAALRLATLRGLGLGVGEILENVTYGHHWKEYSPSEIREYFGLLSRDFEVDVHLHSHIDRDGGLRGLVARCASVLPILRTDIEAVVRLAGRTGFGAVDPALPMTRTGS